jgi:glycosyltransferase involved in cell wall biosynthesis
LLAVRCARDNYSEELKKNVTVIASLALPPPIEGHAVVSSAVVSELKKSSSKVVIIDTSPKTADRKRLSYHIKRVLSVFVTLVSMARHSFDPTRTLYTVYESGFGVTYNFVTLAIGRALGFRIVLHHHTSAHTLARKMSFSVLALISGPRTSHVVLSDRMASDLRQKYSAAERVFVSGNAYCAAEPTGINVRTEERCAVRVGVLSNLSIEKGLNVAIKAAFLARERGLKLTFVIAGPTIGEEASRILETARSQAPELFEIVGQIKGERKDNFFRSIDIFLFPSIYKFEAQPLVLLEAMSYGIPVISTDIGYTKELAAANSEFVVSISSEIVENLVEKLSELIVSPAVYRSESLSSRARYLAMRKSSEEQLIKLCELIALGQIQ